MMNMGFPSGTSGKELACQFRRLRLYAWVKKIPWVWKIPGRRKWQPTPIFLPGKFHGQRSLMGYSQWGPKELGKTEHAHKHTIIY